MFPRVVVQHDQVPLGEAQEGGVFPGYGREGKRRQTLLRRLSRFEMLSVCYCFGDQILSVLCNELLICSRVEQDLKYENDDVVLDLFNDF